MTWAMDTIKPLYMFEKRMQDNFHAYSMRQFVTSKYVFYACKQNFKDHKQNHFNKV